MDSPIGFDAYSARDVVHKIIMQPFKRCVTANLDGTDRHCNAQCDKLVGGARNKDDDD